MAKQHPPDELRRFALKLPETEEGSSCNKSAFRARNKAFFYLGIKDDSFNMMLKIGPSATDAEQLQEKHPDNYGVGSDGWVKVEFTTDQTPPVEMLLEWIEESYRLLVHKQLVQELDLQQSGGTTRPRKTAKKRAVKKSTRRAAASKKSTPRAAASKKRAPTKKSVAKKATKKKTAKKRK